MRRASQDGGLGFQASEDDFSRPPPSYGGISHSLQPVVGMSAFIQSRHSEDAEAGESSVRFRSMS